MEVLALLNRKRFAEADEAARGFPADASFKAPIGNTNSHFFRQRVDMLTTDQKKSDADSALRTKRSKPERFRGGSDLAYVRGFALAFGGQEATEKGH